MKNPGTVEANGGAETERSFGGTETKRKVRESPGGAGRIKEYGKRKEVKVIEDEMFHLRVMGR